MKYARRADGNQAKIVEALRAAGCRVVPTHTIGQGFPDLVVDYHGRTCLVEIKDPKQPPSKRRLTPAQEEFHAAWTGPIYTVESPEHAVLCATGRPMPVTEESKGVE
ncbi:hypothetical protein [Paraburkholderia phenoliruptrix]|uniref:hypothetical protein n=1 Tax=Paraburkholderia phenoliruptrix TaxID=252970 RepID=UPI0028669527|nr:hypothetical protein [Paraburkholderia phenoliruptrix]MDR6393039.1 hypothetical protein [Paraburkholderia phenoliruptrix]